MRSSTATRTRRKGDDPNDAVAGNDFFWTKGCARIPGCILACVSSVSLRCPQAPQPTIERHAPRLSVDRERLPLDLVAEHAARLGGRGLKDIGVGRDVAGRRDGQQACQLQCCTPQPPPARTYMLSVSCSSEWSIVGRASFGLASCSRLGDRAMRRQAKALVGPFKPCRGDEDSTWIKQMTRCSPAVVACYRGRVGGARPFTTFLGAKIHVTWLFAWVILEYTPWCPVRAHDTHSTLSQTSAHPGRCAQL